ncbi:hypothetical protein [Stenotrophomonas sp.]|uniref:hypothetical protein n=1 Tax=Stenotrophomonas sp. TaxID=69392 RepID=UPI0025DBD419|nr:hypothetical protein [Stenotrophomonas sp.]
MSHPRRIVPLLVLAYLGMLFGGALLKPGYSHMAQYISELGASGSAHARLISWPASFRWACSPPGCCWPARGWRRSVAPAGSATGC